jgi:hypothetical protein
MTDPAGLKPGDEIRCGRCERVILVCVESCPPGSYMKSESFTYPDGTALTRQARMQCQFCKSDYITIMTAQKVTVPKGRGA